jgi:hypothetical protein
MLSDSIKAPCVADLVKRLEGRLPPLEPKGVANAEVQQRLEALSLEDLFNGESIVSEDFARAVQSGLHLWNDSLNTSHTIAQKVETETGSYWHALMHRREPDYSNSKHWWRRVGEHPLFPEVRASALKVLSGAERGWGLETRQRLEASDRWLPFDFVDWCEACAKGQLVEARSILEQIQLEEIRLLMAYSYRRAVR